MWAFRILASSWLTVAGAAFALDARAEIYKYQKKDGTVAYTDNLQQLPKDRREYYAKLKEERDARRQELERQLGKDEVARRAAEAKRAEINQAQLQDNERTLRLARIDAELKVLHEKSKAREKEREGWRKRMKDTQQRLAKLLQEFNAATERYNSVAIKPSFTLLPGEHEELERLQKELGRLEGEIDRAIEQVEITIPEEARKAGIPPGWLR